MVQNRQRIEPIDLNSLQAFARRALAECLRVRSTNSTLAELAEVPVILVSDRRMAELHRQFLGLAGPTDVITFQHGEIVISAETARSNAKQFGTAVLHEIQLYLVHGLLHLHGFDDTTVSGAQKMKGTQNRLLVRMANFKCLDG